MNKKELSLAVIRAQAEQDDFRMKGILEIFYDDGGYGDAMDKTEADTENDTDTADGSTAEEPMEESADAGDTADPADANGVIITG